MSCSCVRARSRVVKPMRYQVPAALLAETFQLLRQCGGGRRECQVLWTSEWSRPETISGVAHPRHRAHAGGFEVASPWISEFWRELSRTGRGIRVQIHTHPGEAFHSITDDAFPIIQSIGFLSLVIPDFAQGPVGFERAYLAEITSDGAWREVPPESRLEIVQ
jgi:hypothetical protein